MTSFGNRIIVLIDMDCFFCQVEAKLNPELKGKPMAVIQYNTFGPGAIIAVSYEAREFGVTRHMRGDEAKKKCPHIELVTVPPIRNKPDASRYRNAGKQVIEVLAKYCNTVERASVDEAYLDITDLVEKKLATMSDCSLDDIKIHLSSTFVVGHCDDDSNDEDKRRVGIDNWIDDTFDDTGDIHARKLAIAGIIVEELRTEVYLNCEYRCSAGISYNKILAKLACGLHKPNKQTILSIAEVPRLYSSLPVNKVRNLGGKFGNIVMESLGCNVMADLLRYSLHDLQKRFDEKTGSWLYNIARGIDNEPVLARLVGKSIGSSKNFPGKQAITKLDTLKYWIGELAAELVERLEEDLDENKRRATSLSINYHFIKDKKVIGQSRICSLSSYKHEKIVNICLNIITKAMQKPIVFIGMSAGKFISAKDTGTFINFFKVSTSQSTNNSNNQLTIDNSNVPVTQEIIVANSNNHFNDDVKSLKDKCAGSCSETCKQSENDDKKLSAKSCESTIIDCKNSNLISNTDIIKTFNGDNLKNSFFMNFLKDSKSSLVVNGPIKKPFIEENNESIDKNQYKINDDTMEHLENESPVLFNDVESQECTKKIDQCMNNDGDITNTNVKVNSSVKLVDIFPNLDNIDLSVVQLLPIELQREANTYLKLNKSVKTIDTTKSGAKNSGCKLKSVKINTASPEKSTKINNCFINNFLVKNSTNSNDLLLMKRCPQCDQIIKMEKFNEHSDFHVAQNLQRIINQSSINNTQINNSNKLTKRKLDTQCLQSNKKSRNIESFFTK